MNRRKKAVSLIKARQKRASAKLSPKGKAKYISKADRAKLAQEPAHDSDSQPET